MSTPDQPSLTIPLSSLPSPPFITSIPNLVNLRDAGGYAVASTGSVRRGLIFRSGETTRCNASDRAALASLGVRTVFDLRSDAELVARRAQLAAIPEQKLGLDADLGRDAGIDVRWTPVFSQQAYDPAAIAERYKEYMNGSADAFARAYAEILEAGGSAIREVLVHVRDRPRQAFLVHCSAGKDRTGVTVALLLGLAGVGDEDIAREYALTELGMAAKGDGQVGAFREVAVKHLVEGPMKLTREGALRMTASRKESMLATLAMIREKYGGVEGYVKKECGLNDKDITTIRKNLISTDAAVL